MLKGSLSPDQVLKAIAELVVENEVLKKEVELLRGQLDYLKGTRTDLSNVNRRLPSDLLSNEEAAEYLRISPQTLSSWRSQGPHEIPYTKVGRAIRYRVADLDAFLFRSERSFGIRKKAEI